MTHLMPTFTMEGLRGLIETSMTLAGLSQDEACVCADAATFADARGTDTHGVVYILPKTLQSLRQGRTISRTEPTLLRCVGATALLQGRGVAGPVLGTRAIRLAVEKAREYGVGCVVTRNGNPLGLLGYYPSLALPAGMLGLTMANTSPSVAPFGSSARLFGTNPFAFAAPGNRHPGVLFDAASSTAAAGKLARARRRGQELEVGWVIDASGEPILNPNLADEGALLPFGGHKGSAVALLVHILTGVLAGTTIGGEFTHENADPLLRGQSAFFLAVDPEAFGSRKAFREMMDRQIEAVHAARPVPGVRCVLVPGERGWQEAARRKTEGIHVSEEDWQVVVEALRAAGLPVEDLLRRFT
jgi:LDH2 family malate/lactate/ureidoglycolate dehydrogenase